MTPFSSIACGRQVNGTQWFPVPARQEHSHYAGVQV
ncbi:hypothetical protein ACP_3500 [Acidobacterium capsulatum ATCC 51196]|uniref:Uncharacterized protein n=1 Tax=Acidobacterium capsulatum (strain ATCC 51196 / DSM 11244 / BCRC 80197 / JCM 7670 / NBRC 15755 / NCIMB 13165 / 161) TaxID=240015 RepID=C1F730_ACIC5|nr:hypothetical protein ACP_3500 [Acidobacterium capsulatum ATCC 51196]